MSSDEAYVTLATNDSYGLGALVLGHSLRLSGCSKTRAILITPEVSQSMKHQLSEVFQDVTVVNVWDSQDTANLALLQRPELGVTLTKLHCWTLTKYKKCVFLDADTLVVKNVDELFGRSELSAAPDVGWPDCFNSGVFVFQPSLETYSNLIKFAQEHGSFDGGDQGLLNSYFADWSTADIATHLPFIYNMVATVVYTYAPAFKKYGDKVKIIHFLGANKPWHQETTGQSATQPFLNLWWAIFNNHVRQHLEPGLRGLAGQFGKMSVGHPTQHHAGSQSGYSESRRSDWESGQIDYMGADKFENIQKKISESIQAASAARPGVSGQRESLPTLTAQQQSSGQQQPQQKHETTPVSTTSKSEVGSERSPQTDASKSEEGSDHPHSIVETAKETVVHAGETVVHAAQNVLEKAGELLTGAVGMLTGHGTEPAADSTTITTSSTVTTLQSGQTGPTGTDRQKSPAPTGQTVSSTQSTVGSTMAQTGSAAAAPKEKSPSPAPKK